MTDRKYYRLDLSTRRYDSEDASWERYCHLMTRKSEPPNSVGVSGYSNACPVCTGVLKHLGGDHRDLTWFPETAISFPPVTLDD